MTFSPGFNNFNFNSYYYWAGAAVLGLGSLAAVNAVTAKTKTVADTEILEVTLRDRADTHNMGSGSSQSTSTTHTDVCTVTFRSAEDRFVKTASFDCSTDKDAYGRLVAAKADRDQGVRCTLSFRESWISDPVLSGLPSCE